MVLWGIVMVHLFSACSEDKRAAETKIVELQVAYIMEELTHFHSDFECVIPYIHAENDRRYLDFDQDLYIVDTMFNRRIWYEFENAKKEYNARRAELLSWKKNAVASLGPKSASAISLQKQIDALDNEFAIIEAGYQFKKAVFISMFPGEVKKGEFDLSSFMLNTMSAIINQLNYVQSMIAHNNSGFFNRWINIFNWRKTMDADDPKWWQLQDELSQKEEELDCLWRNFRRMQDEFEACGLTREVVRKLIAKREKTGKSYIERCESKISKKKR